MAEAFLETPRLYLRPLRANDADGPYLGWFNDAEVCRHNAHHVFPYRHEDAAAYIDAVAGSKRDLVFAIVLRDGDRHIGNISLQAIDPVHRSAEFAVVVGEKDCWGQGYALEAATALVRHAFEALNLNRIECGTVVDNHAMRMLAAALGMKEEGRRRQALFKNGDYVDVVEFGVLRSEFKARSTPQ